VGEWYILGMAGCACVMDGLGKIRIILRFCNICALTFRQFHHIIRML